MTSIRIAMRDGSAVTVPLRQMEHPVRRDGSGWTNWKDLREAMSARKPWAVDETTVLSTRYIVRAELVEDGEEPEHLMYGPEDRLGWIMNHLEDLPEKLVQHLEEEYGIAFYVLSESTKNVKKQNLDIGYQRAILRFVAKQTEEILGRTDEMVLAEMEKKKEESE